MRTRAKLYHAVGVDISDGSLEMADVSLHKGRLTLETRGRVELPGETVVHGVIQDTKRLDELFRKLLSETHTHRGSGIIVALPDAQVIVKELTIPSADRHRLGTLAEHAHSIVRALKLPMRDPIVRWKLRNTVDGLPVMLIYVTRRCFVHQWEQFFSRHGMHLVVLEMESSALMRSFARMNNSRVYSLLDLGYRTTSLSIFLGEDLCYSHTVEFGSHDIITMLMGEWDIPYAEADRLKQTVGFDVKSDQKVAILLRQKFQDVLSELEFPRLRKKFIFSRTIITGSGSLMPAAADALTEILGNPCDCGTLSVGSGSPSARAFSKSAPLSKEEEAYYSGAIGLAIRGVDRESISAGINFLSNEFTQ